MSHISTLAKRQHILAAANTVVRRDGVAHLTIEAVAREAGVSKGGVLHHFPSKDALVEGMVMYLIEQFEQDLARALEGDAAEAGRWFQAYIRASCYPALQDNEAASGLFAAFATNPQLLEPLRQRYTAWQARIEEAGISPVLATIIRLAIDGLWFSELLGLAPPQGAFREAIIAELLRWSSPPSTP